MGGIHRKNDHLHQNEKIWDHLHNFFERFGPIAQYVQRSGSFAPFSHLKMKDWDNENIKQGSNMSFPLTFSTINIQGSNMCKVVNL